MLAAVLAERHRRELERLRRPLPSATAAWGPAAAAADAWPTLQHASG